MGSQTNIALGVIGVLLVLFLATLYARFDVVPAEEPAVNVRVSVNPNSETKGTQPTIVGDTGNHLPPEALTPVSPLSPTPQIGPSPETLLPRQPTGGLLTPAEYEARRAMSWPFGGASHIDDAGAGAPERDATPLPLDERRFLLQPSLLR
ncbi:MAG: hypothetical protein KDB14_32700 [Planctomycetales bacterium]|nr:hypothetical protein [Planctomycetales bacterium]